MTYVLWVLQLFLITLVASYCFSCVNSYPMESDRSTSADSEDLVPDKDVESVCNTLRTIDETLTKINTDPPADGGNEMLKLMRTYNEASRILLEHCKSDKFTAFPPAKDLLERGGPEFLDVDIDENQLEQRFNWDQGDLQDMHNARKRTNILWYDLWRVYNNIPIPDA